LEPDPIPDRQSEHEERRVGAANSNEPVRTSGVRRWLALPAGALVAASLLASCSGGGGADTITVYNGQHPQLTQALVAAFEKQTGIQVRVRTDDGIVLADQILQEGSSSPADVYLTENSPELVMLTERHLLAKLPPSITDQIPSRFDSPTGNWVGMALRVCSLVYNPSLISASQLPRTFLDLAQPQWKGKLAISPTDSDFVPQVGAVIATYGRQATVRWLAGLKANAALYQGEEATVAAVDRGQVAVGVINQYYWYRLRLELGAGNIHSKLYFFPNRDVGGIENVGGAAVLASSHKLVSAERFVSFLVSAKAQRILAQGDDFEYPARPGIAPNPALPLLSQINPAILSVVRLGNDLTAASLIQQAGLT
jgi:iron(III) transport system substrate-binding protein